MNDQFPVNQSMIDAGIAADTLHRDSDDSTRVTAIYRAMCEAEDTDPLDLDEDESD